MRVACGTRGRSRARRRTVAVGSREAGLVRHVQLVIHRLWVDGMELPLRLSTIVVVDRDESVQLDWEVVAESTVPITLDLHRAHLAMSVIVGADPDGVLAYEELRGEAIIVRFVETTVVMRG